MITAIICVIHFECEYHLKKGAPGERKLAMKVSKDVMANHKEQVIKVAARRFRQRGFDGVSVADIMNEAGLTHGGFYRHFSSKDELIAISTLRAVSETVGKWQKIADQATGDRLEAVVHSYLSLRHHDHPETGCLVAALGGELSHQPPSVKDAATNAGRQMIDFLSRIAPGKTKAVRRKQAIVVLASMAGGMILARMTSDRVLREEILKDVAHAVPNSVSATV
jgi:TetR/AcrR family transcriptional regulator, transcriptional repressor for nem operon